MEASIVVMAPPPGRSPDEAERSAGEARRSTDGAWPREPPRAPDTLAPSAAPPVARRPEVDEPERSPLLSRTLAGDDLLSSARRAGLGFLLAMPFTLAAGLGTGADLRTAVSAALSLPAGLTLVALVGVAASTLGISLVSAPLAPTVSARLASHGLFRTGLVLAGLAPLTALWVASGAAIESLFVATLSVFGAGVLGIGVIARGLVSETVEDDGQPRLGALVVSAVFVMFALVVGLRIWVEVGGVLLPPFLGDFE